MFKWLENLIWLLVENVFGLDPATSLAGSIHFFFYDVIKILILLSLMIFAISYVRSFFQPERTKQIVSRFRGITANFMASLLGIVTPFCSCSSVPLFIGFVEGGIPLGVTFSFLITSPIVNEAAFVILLASFGIKVAVVYVACGVIIGTLGGFLIGRLKMEKYVEEYVWKMQMGAAANTQLNHKQRMQFAWEQLHEIIKRIWIYLLIGIGIGAAIHGWAPEAILARYAGPENPFAVIVAVICGIPLYSNAMGAIPIAEALIGKGVGLGTALAFLMAVTALSLPEMIILRKVIKPRLIASFLIITGIGIILVGYLFNGIYFYL
ncbi:MAG: permease [Candidatus Cloacimonetes bacterium]|nr:permease [Candidatus Cloacimonadota bacterium]